MAFETDYIKSDPYNRNFKIKIKKIVQNISNIISHKGKNHKGKKTCM